jgi:anaerobic selenocysteine-containing dehydrogenase
MRQAIPPVGGARNDCEVFAGLAARLGLAAQFTEGRTEMEWLRALYETSRQRAAALGVELPAFDAFWRQGYVEVPAPARPPIMLEVRPGRPPPPDPVGDPPPSADQRPDLREPRFERAAGPRAGLPTSPDLAELTARLKRTPPSPT